MMNKKAWIAYLKNIMLYNKYSIINDYNSYAINNHLVKKLKIE